MHLELVFLSCLHNDHLSLCGFSAVSCSGFCLILNNSFCEPEIHTTAVDYSFQMFSFTNILRLNSCYSPLPTLRSKFPIDHYSAQF